MTILRHVIRLCLWLVPWLAGAAFAGPAYVGVEACRECHAAETALWRGSHHDLAMQAARADTVLGDFDDKCFEYAGITTRFFRREGKFITNTDGADGKLADFEVRYTFGVFPLQQYLIELPGGRLQALGIAWDSRPAEAGGQRWFHLYPGERITHEDELHWTARSQNWNRNCAECHSTHLQKGFDAASRSYRTTWSEIDVSCEACHGPGAAHVNWAGRPAGDRDPNDDGLTGGLHRDSNWSPEGATGMPINHGGAVTGVELETCAACHSRRAQLFEDDRHGQPLMDSFLPALLEPDLYYVDGQIQGEVYEYGSFLQSRMFASGVTCSDCHDPHSLGLRVPGNGVCLQCHGAARYDAAGHHHHEPGTAGAACVACHMPSRTYMRVDVRHDHGFRVPRPAQSMALGVPNACNQCHGDESFTWMADRVRAWHGHDPSGYQRYAATLAAARNGDANAGAGLIRLLGDRGQPNIARATAAARMSRWLDQPGLQALSQALSDGSPIVRAGATDALLDLPIDLRYPLLRPLLRDPVRVVRALAAESLGDAPLNRLSIAEQRVLETAWAEYLAGNDFNADDSAAAVNRGNFLVARGELVAAEAAYRGALAIDANWIPAYVNLADLLRMTGRDDEGATLLKQGIAVAPASPDLHHSLGLLYVRQHAMSMAIAELQQAAELAPHNARYNYVYVVALNSDGQTAAARAALAEALQRMPNDRSLNELRTYLQ